MSQLLDNLGFARIRKGIAIDGFCIEAGSLGRFMKRGGVVVAGSGRFGFCWRFLKANTQGVCTATKRGGNTGGQTKPGGAAEHQYFFGATFHRTFLLGESDLLPNIRRTTLGVSVDTNKTTYFWFDNHEVGLLMSIGSAKQRRPL